MGRRSRMSSGFFLVFPEGPFSVPTGTEPVLRAVSLRRVKRILDGESGHDWHERSGRYDDAEAEGFGDHEAEMQPVENEHSFGDYDGVREGPADDNDDPTDELLMHIGALARAGKR